MEFSQYGSLNVAVNNYCNLGCSHCFLGDERKNRETLNIDKLEKMQFSPPEGSKIQINWAGGEIMSLGKRFFREKIISSRFFRERDKFYNKIYTMMPVYDEEWKEILHKFDEFQCSIDIYHMARMKYDKKYIENIRSLNLPKTVSFTPSNDDNYDTMNVYFNFAKEIGAYAFHLGMYYPDLKKGEKPISVEKMIELLEIAIELEKKYDLPLGFFREKQIEHNLGWTAFYCFDKGFYIQPNGIVTSCPIIDANIENYNILNKVKLDEFVKMSNEEVLKINEEIQKTFYMQRYDPECISCKYYTLCKGGCPFFTYIGNGHDIYCKYYKRVFDEIINRSLQKD